MAFILDFYGVRAGLLLHDAAWRKSSHSGSNEGSCVEVSVVGRDKPTA